MAQPLDRSQFISSVDVVMLVLPVAKTNEFMKRLKPFMFNRPKMRSVVTPEACPSIFANFDSNMRGVLLSEEIEKLATDDDDLLAGLPASEKEWALSEGAVPVRHKVQLGYELLNMEQVLRQVLPSSIPEIPSSFETAGHIAHLNLREEVRYIYMLLTTFFSLSLSPFICIYMDPNSVLLLYICVRI